MLRNENIGASLTPRTKVNENGPETNVRSEM